MKFLNITKIIKNKLKFILLAVFAIFFILFFVKQSFGVETVSNVDLIDRIEKTLSLEKNHLPNRTSKFILDRGKSGGVGGVNIEVKEKIEDKSNRTKEKLAYNALQSGQYEAALEIYKQIVKSEKTNNYAKFGLATSYHKLHQLKQAKKAYFELLGVEIDNKNEVISNLLEILVEESPKDAKYILARLTSQSPDADYILARTALVYDKLKKPDDATLLLKRAIALNPEKLQYKFNLAVILDQNDEKNEALRYYKKIISQYISSGSKSQDIDLAAIKKRINFIEKNY